jgi:hypothetical protein
MLETLEFELVDVDDAIVDGHGASLSGASSRKKQKARSSKRAFYRRIGLRGSAICVGTTSSPATFRAGVGFRFPIRIFERPGAP